MGHDATVDYRDRVVSMVLEVAYEANVIIDRMSGHVQKIRKTRLKENMIFQFASGIADEMVASRTGDGKKDRYALSILRGFIYDAFLGVSVLGTNYRLFVETAFMDAEQCIAYESERKK